jgi:hypothetical protein
MAFNPFPIKVSGDNNSYTQLDETGVQVSTETIYNQMSPAHLTITSANGDISLLGSDTPEFKIRQMVDSAMTPVVTINTDTTPYLEIADDTGAVPLHLQYNVIRGTGALNLAGNNHPEGISLGDIVQTDRQLQIASGLTILGETPSAGQVLTATDASGGIAWASGGDVYLSADNAFTGSNSFGQPLTLNAGTSSTQYTYAGINQSSTELSTFSFDSIQNSVPSPVKVQLGASIFSSPTVTLDMSADPASWTTNTANLFNNAGVINLGDQTKGGSLINIPKGSIQTDTVIANIQTLSKNDLFVGVNNTVSFPQTNLQQTTMDIYGSSGAFHTPSLANVHLDGTTTTVGLTLQDYTGSATAKSSLTPLSLSFTDASANLFSLSSTFSINNPLTIGYTPSSSIGNPALLTKLGSFYSVMPTITKGNHLVGANFPAGIYVATMNLLGTVTTTGVQSVGQPLLALLSSTATNPLTQGVSLGGMVNLYPVASTVTSANSPYNWTQTLSGQFRKTATWSLYYYYTDSTTADTTYSVGINLVRMG